MHRGAEAASRKSAKQPGPQPSPNRPVRSDDLREGGWTRPATARSKSPRLSASGEASAHAATPTARPLSRLLARLLARPLSRLLARPLARSLAPCGSELPRGLRALRAAGTQERSLRPRSSASSRPACPGQASHPQDPQEEQDASSQESTANGSDRSIAFRETAASQGGRQGGGAERVKGRAATSPGEELGKCAQDRVSSQPLGHLTSGWGGATVRASLQVRRVPKRRRLRADGECGSKHVTSG